MTNPEQQKQELTPAELQSRLIKRFEAAGGSVEPIERDPEDAFMAEAIPRGNDPDDPRSREVQWLRFATGHMPDGQGGDDMYVFFQKVLGDSESPDFMATKFVSGRELQAHQEKLRALAKSKGGMALQAVEQHPAPSRPAYHDGPGEAVVSRRYIDGLLAGNDVPTTPVNPELGHSSEAPEKDDDATTPRAPRPESQASVGSPEATSEDATTQIEARLRQMEDGLSDSDKTALWQYATAIHGYEFDNAMKKLSNQARGLAASYRSVVDALREARKSKS